MLKRPKPGEDEEDLLRMQEEFLREKNKNPSLQSAAQVVNLRNQCKSNSPRTSSIYAKAKGLKKGSDKRVRFDNSTSCVGNIVEKNTEADDQHAIISNKNEESENDKVYYPKVLPFVLGDIIEKNLGAVDISQIEMPCTGFPTIHQCDESIQSENKSIYLSNLEKQRKLKTDLKISPFDVNEGSSNKYKSSNSESLKLLNLPDKSYILTSNESDAIHKENVEVLTKMSEEQILQERNKLLSSLDPALIKFVKSKRKGFINTKEQRSETKELSDCTILKMESSTEKMDFSENLEEFIENVTLWDNDVISHPNVSNWLHFDTLERNKLEWMKGIEQSNKSNPNEPYEARFDFRGYLLPYTIEYTEKTKTLFHHGEEPHRPGYSFAELFQLSRSTLPQQRVMALNTIAGILEYHVSGIYKDVIEIPLSKILFVVRFAIDENIVIILEPALKAMRNLLFNRFDEACLDLMVGTQYVNQQPCLENDKSEIAELETQESELKDFHLAEIDIIAACLRTNILQRLHYILEKIRPSFNCVQYSLQILTRLVRDSTDTALKIVQTEHLMYTIIQNFVPSTSINFKFEPNMVYRGKPVLSALKFIRILSIQTEKNCDLLLTKYGISNALSNYISSNVDGTYGVRIQIEAFCIMLNSLSYNIGIETAMLLFPVLITTLYKHVKGTNLDSGGLILTHAAMLIQLISRLLTFEAVQVHKYEIYPLIRDGLYKWINQFGKCDMYTHDQLKLVSSVVDCTKTILMCEKNVPVDDLINNLNLFFDSNSMKMMEMELVLSSNLLSKIEKVQLHYVKNLMSLNTTVVDSNHKLLPILNKTSPFVLFISIFHLLDLLNNLELTKKIMQRFCTYFKKLSIESPSLCDNWFTRMETDLIFIVLKVAVTRSKIQECDRDVLYGIANKLCYIFRSDKKCEVEFLFSNVIFNKAWFTTEHLLSFLNLSDIETVSIECIQTCYKKFLNFETKTVSAKFVSCKWQEPILPRDWIYLPILNLYSQSQEIDSSSKVLGMEENSNETDKILPLVKSSLEWILLNEMCFSDLLNDINLTDRFCRIMCVFLCTNSLFLEPKIKVLLNSCLQLLFKKEKQNNFAFDRELVGLNNFQDFYTQFLEQFQSVSYGDYNFAACVLVPLSQKHNVKWRKILWSEYAGCLRALDCPEDMLCYDINDYLYPEETDESLIKCYFRALSTNLLRPGTISYKIALHHTQCYKKNCV